MGGRQGDRPRGVHGGIGSTASRAPSTPLERARANIAAIRALVAIESEGRAATPAEREELLAYAGWGGQPDAFAEDLGGRPAWAEVRDELRSLITEDQFAEARASTLTAFYTPPAVAEAMLIALADAGLPRGANVLEPGCGTGAFMEAAEGLGLGLRFTGVEMDAISVRVARALHPDATIVHAPLERCRLAEGSYDAVVGNVPYSDAVTVELDGRSLPLHDYFVRASVRAVRPGGLACLLTSRHTLDKSNAATRLALAEEAELVAALRLPEGTFERDAGTSVVCDLLVLRRRPERVPDASPEWVGTSEVAPGVAINALMARDPSLTVGEAHVGTGRFGATLRVTGGPEGTALGQEALRRLAGQLGPLGDVYAEAAPRLAEPSCSPEPEARAEFEYVLGEDGTVWYGDGETLDPVTTRVAGDLARLRGQVALRDLTRETLALEASTDDDEAVRGAIGRLDGAYDAFVAEFGRVSDARNVRAWATMNDHSGAQLLALERLDPRGRFEAKGDMLVSRVRRPAPPMPEHLDDPEGALEVSLDRTGGVDLALIARLLGTTDEGALLALGDRVVMDPDDHSPVLAAEYLSGDVGRKLSHVRGLIAAEEDGGRSAAVASWAVSCGIEASLARDRGADAIIGTLAGTGAWAELVDPDGSGLALDMPAQVEEACTWRASRSTPLVLAEAVRVGTRPLGCASALRPQEALGGLFGRAWREMFCSTDRAARDLAVLWRVAVADPEDVGDAEFAFLATRMLEDRSTWRGRNGAAVDCATLEGLCPGIGAREAYEARNAWPYGAEDLVEGDVAPCLAFGRRLRGRPEVLEYLHSLASRRPEGWEADASAEGLADFARRREGYVGALTREPDAGRLAELRALEARLAAAQPARLGPGEIAVDLGSTWVPARHFMDFAREVVGWPRGGHGATTSQRCHAKIEHSAETGSWQVYYGGTGGADPRTASEFGTSLAPATRILGDSLNNRMTKVYKEDPDNPKRRVLDPQATAIARRCQDALGRAFADWVWTDPERTRDLCDIYNGTFNTIAPRKYDGSYLTLPGMNSSVELRKHQRDAVARVFQSPDGTLLAHAVGAGKTFEGIACAMEARRLGRAQKPLFAVPNPLVEQWAADFMRLYPGARVLYATNADSSSAEAMLRFWQRAATGTWDAVIVGHSRFSRLRLSPEKRAEYLGRRIGELERTVLHAKETNGAGSFTVKQLEALRARLSDKVRKLRSQPAAEGVTFEDLGVDFLFVDESHNYKNLAVETTLNVSGAQVNESMKCEDLLDKCDWLREEGHGSNIVFATGTPVTNTMTELFNLERYLAPGLLEAQGCSTFDAWASTFGEVVEQVEMRPEGKGLQVRSRFSRFHNLPELMAAFHTFADIMTADDLNLDVPECEKVNVKVEPTDEQRRLVDLLGRRADAVHAGQVDPSVDNLLKITSEGRKIALDPKLLRPDDPEVQPLAGGKIAACAENVRRIWGETAESRGTQLVFCDASTPASGTWNVYADLKRRLVELGVPEAEVAFVHDARNQAQLEQLFNRVDDGEVRVLVGSTQKLGTGVNVQHHLVATHDLDCPWRPSDLEQRLGRIVRQGNPNELVHAYRYVTSGTFDSYLYQAVERKQRFIAQVFTNASPARAADDIDEASLDYGTIKALATGDPSIRRRMELENRRQQLELLRQARAAELDRTRMEVRLTLGPALAAASSRLDALRADEGALAEAAASIERSRQAGTWSIEVMGEVLSDRRGANEALRAAAVRAEVGRGPFVVGRYRGLGVAATATAVRAGETEGVVRRLAVVGESRHEPSGSVAAGADCVAMLDRVICGMPERVSRAEEAVARAREDLEAAQASLGSAWDDDAELAEVEGELALLDAATLGQGAQECFGSNPNGSLLSEHQHMAASAPVHGEEEVPADGHPAMPRGRQVPSCPRGVGTAPNGVAMPPNPLAGSQSCNIL